MRVRRSLQELVSLYDAGDRTQLENLVRAFRKIQALPPNDPDSFFVIAGYHGEPFVKEDPTNPDWWGEYCQHQTVLFPTWHRAYLYRLENALRNALPEAPDLALPFWDEPWFVTARQLPDPVNGKTDNPLFSYTLQKDLADNHSTPDVSRYTKPAGYQTIRYPLSGLYLDHTTNTKILNSNVKAWLDGTVKIKPDGDPNTRIPDTYSVYSRFQICLKAPNYTVFSNKASMAQYIIENGGQPHNSVALEEPHNAIHLALGGFYESGNYNADPILGANGDMGENETAAFDPIFYLHHAFIDYTFWQWQLRQNCTATGSLTVEAGKDGTISLGDPTFPKGTVLDTNSPLDPFTKPGGGFYTSEDVTDINKLGYSYGRGSLDNDPARLEPPTEPMAKIARVHNVSRADYAGSFVIRTHVELPSGEKVGVGREAVLSRWNVAGCRNCQDHLNENSFIAIDNKTMEVLKGNTDDEAKINFHVQIQSLVEFL
ncbi:tyrosinase [Fusarium bulbicola]|nr:tyrosinase [Fusarium bulbicola]